MSGSDFKLKDSVRAVFTCERGTVLFYFVHEDQAVGKDFLYTLEEAANLGERIFKTGTWAEFPLAEFPLQRLGASASACGITASMAVKGGQRTWSCKEIIGISTAVPGIALLGPSLLSDRGQVVQRLIWSTFWSRFCEKF